MQRAVVHLSFCSHVESSDGRLQSLPFVKTGGLADVVGSLPSALAAYGDQVAVVLPRYRRISLDGAAKVYDNLTLSFAGRGHRTDIFAMHVRGVPYYFVDCPPLFDRDGLYDSGGWGFWDNHVRFAVLSRAAVEIARRMHRPQILHCHDWQSALVPVYLRHTFANDPTFVGIKSLLTLHNLGYQGHFGREVLPHVGLDDSLYRMDLLELNGMVNYLKGGIVYSHAINTVSQAYAAEIQRPEFGFGLDGLLRARSSVLTGISTVRDHESRFRNRSTNRGKLFGARSHRKADLQTCAARRAAPANRRSRKACDRDCLRFASQKGFDLIEQVCSALMSEDVNLVILGKGEAHYEWVFSHLAGDNPRKVATWVGYRNDARAPDRSRL